MNDKAYIVSIELNNTAAREKFERGGFGNRGAIVKILENVYVFRANYNCTSAILRDAIISFMGTDEINILVMKTSIDAAWRLTPSLDSFLKATI